MRRHGLSTRSLGARVGVSNGTVAGWTRGAAPRADAAKRLADCFGIPVDVLLDDARDLPAEYSERQVAESPGEHLVAAPLRAAAQMADRTPGTAAERQRSFETYVKLVRDLRAEAEAIAGGNQALAVTLLDKWLAAWMAGEHSLAPEDNAAVRAAIEAGRKKGFAKAGDLLRGQEQGEHGARTG